MSENRLEGALAADQARDIAANVSRSVEQQPIAGHSERGVVGYVLGWLTHRR